jgi:hypothetical protein
MLMTTGTRRIGIIAATVSLGGSVGVGAWGTGCSSSAGGLSAPDGGSDAITTNDAGKPEKDGSKPNKDSGSDTSTSADGAPEATTSDATDSGRLAAVSVSPAALPFTSMGNAAGFVSCGSSPATQTFTVTNNGSQSYTYYATFATGSSSLYSLSPAGGGTFGCTQAAPCTLAAGASAVVTVTGPPVPANAGITTYDDTLTVFTSAPGGSAGQAVSLSEASYGAILAYNPTSQNWGPEPEGEAYTQAIGLVNSGNGPVTVNLALTTSDPTSSGEFTLSGNTGLAVPVAGASFDAIFTPTANDAGNQAASGAVAVTVATGGGAVCAALPNELPLSGSGTTSSFTVTSSLNFNLSAVNGGAGISCGTTAAAQSVVVSNIGGTTPTATLALGLGSNSAFTAPASVQINANGTTDITVTPKTIPASSPPAADLNDTLVITIDGVNHYVALTETSAGAVLSLYPSSVTFSPTGSGGTTNYPLTLTNSGNVTATVTFGTSGAPFTLPAGNYTATADANTTPNATFRPTAADNFTGTGTLTVKSGTPVCSSFSGSIALSFSGAGATNNTFTVTTNGGGATAAFGANDCGEAAPGANTVTITGTVGLNTTGTSVGWTAALGGPGASYYTLSAASGTVETGGLDDTNGTFTITPIALTGSSSLTAAQVLYGLQATVTVTVGTGATQEVFTIPVSETPTGVFAVWGEPQVEVGPGYSSAFTLLNLSSVSGAFTLTSGSPSTYAVTPASGNAVSGTPLSGSAAATASGTAGTIIITASTSTRLCGSSAIPPVLSVINP